MEWWAIDRALLMKGTYFLCDAEEVVDSDVISAIREKSEHITQIIAVIDIGDSRRHQIQKLIKINDIRVQFLDHWVDHGWFAFEAQGF